MPPPPQLPNADQTYKVVVGVAQHFENFQKLDALDEPPWTRADGSIGGYDWETKSKRREWRSNELEPMLCKAILQTLSDALNVNLEVTKKLTWEKPGRTPRWSRDGREDTSTPVPEERPCRATRTRSFESQSPYVYTYKMEFTFYPTDQDVLDKLEAMEE